MQKRRQMAGLRLRQDKQKLPIHTIQFIIGLSVVILAGSIGLLLQLQSRAQTPTASLQADAGMLTSGAVARNDISASGSKAVKFTSTRTIKIMPLGDSITLGWNYYPGTSLPPPGGYRTLLWQKLVQQNGKHIDFVGSLKSGPTTLTDQDHEGHSGYRIDQIRSEVDTYLTSNSPDIILLQIGTNDIVQNYNLATAPDRLRDLVGHICTVKPGVRIVVASIIPKPGMEARVDPYNAQIPVIVSQEQAAGCHASFFDMHAHIIASDLSPADTTHPLPSGYDKMAEAWYPVVSALYTELTGN